MKQSRSSPIKVQCHAGYRGEETPVCFFLGERRVEVLEVLDRWLDPAHRYFKLKGSDEGVYILRHDAERGFWEMTLFDSGACPDTRLSSTNLRNEDNQPA